MKRFFVFAVMLALLSAPALAGKNSQTVNIPMTMKAGSAELAAGNYKLTVAALNGGERKVVVVPDKLVNFVV